MKICEAVTDFSESAGLSDWSRAPIGLPFTGADSLPDLSWPTNRPDKSQHVN